MLVQMFMVADLFWSPLKISMREKRVLTKSKVLKESGITITEDISKKIREARQELKKFLRIVKRNSPDKYCFLQYDKLFVAGKVFIFDEREGKVVEQTNTDGCVER